MGFGKFIHKISKIYISPIGPGLKSIKYGEIIWVWPWKRYSKYDIFFSEVWGFSFGSLKELDKFNKDCDKFFNDYKEDI